MLLGSPGLLWDKIIRHVKTWFNMLEGMEQSTSHRLLAHWSATTGCCPTKEEMVINFVLHNSHEKNKSISGYIYNSMYCIIDESTILLLQFSYTFNTSYNSYISKNLPETCFWFHTFLILLLLFFLLTCFPHGSAACTTGHVHTEIRSLDLHVMPFVESA